MVPSDDTFSVPLQKVCPRSLRERFNRDQFVERGRRREIEVKEKRPALYRYATWEGVTLALAHRKKRRDGRGYLFDPKWLLDGDRALVPEHDDFFVCDWCRARGYEAWY
jgi:hypothetical protein